MRLKQLFLAGVVLAGASVVSADPNIPSFDFETTTGFVGSGWTCSGSAVDVNTCSLNLSNLNGNGTYDTLAWGTERNPVDSQSYLNITNIAGSIITNGGWVDTNYLDHYNHVISSAGGYMSLVSVLGLFEIVSPISLGTGFAAPVVFEETYNQNSDDCPAPNPNGSACDDIFVIPGLSASSAFYYDCDAHGCGWYVLSFRFFAGEGTTVIPNGDGTFSIYTTEACSTDGIAGCGVGEVYSPGISRLILQGRIDYVVPTPETLALLGLGLVGFALRRPRNK